MISPPQQRSPALAGLFPASCTRTVGTNKSFCSLTLFYFVKLNICLQVGFIVISQQHAATPYKSPNSLVGGRKKKQASIR